MLWASLLLLFSTTTFAAEPCDVRAAVRPLFEDSEYSKYLKKIGKNKNPDIQKLYQMVDYTGNKYITPVHTQQIAKIFSNSTLSQTEKAEEAFGVYLEARLKEFTPKERDKILSIVANHDHEMSSYYINGASHPISGEIRLTFPEEYTKTLLHYTFLSHEVEHSIQRMKLSDHFTQSIMPKFSLKPQLNRRLEYESFLSEVGTMKAEAEFVNAIPAADKKLIFNELKASDNKTLNRVGDFFFGNSDSSVEAYVARQWSLGRNQQSKFFWRNIRVKVVQNLPFYLVSNGAKYGVYFGGKHLIKAYCDQQRTKSLSERTARIDHWFCKR